jgi:hypothetical protein
MFEIPGRELGRGARSAEGSASSVDWHIRHFTSFWPIAPTLHLWPRSGPIGDEFPVGSRLREREVAWSGRWHSAIGPVCPPKRAARFVGSVCLIFSLFRDCI